MTQARSDLVVAAALRSEARALRRGRRGLRVLRTGVGPERARAAAPRLLAEAAPAVALAGLCGALDPALEPGALVVASELRGAGGAALTSSPPRSAQRSSAWASRRAWDR